MSLVGKIASWDGKSAKDIKMIYQEFEGVADLSSQLVDMLATTELESGASWLLKYYLENGGELCPADIQGIMRSLPHLEGWAAKLHMLQCSGYWRVPGRSKSRVEKFIRTNLDHPKTLVRAWACHGFFHLANQYPEYQQEVLDLFDQRQQREPASVRARIRNLLKQGFTAPAAE